MKSRAVICFSVLTTENSAESPTPTPIQKRGDPLEI